MERVIQDTNGVFWSADQWAYVHGWAYTDEEFIRTLKDSFGVEGYDRRWKLLNIREKGMFQPQAYPEGFDINQRREGT